MSRRDRRAFRSDARRYLTTDPDGTATVTEAAKWLHQTSFVQSLGLSKGRCRDLVIALRSSDQAMFMPAYETRAIKLIEIDGAALSPTTILAALRRIGG